MITTLKKIALLASMLVASVASANTSPWTSIVENSDGTTTLSLGPKHEGAYVANYYFEGTGGNHVPDSLGSLLLREGRNMFLVFDFNLNSLPGLNLNNLVGAQLILGNPKYMFDDHSEELSLYDVTTNIDELIAAQTERFDIFQDLESGVKYGSLIMPDYHNPYVNFNTIGLNAIKSSSGLFAIGGSLNIVTEQGTNESRLWTDEGDGYYIQLTFATPVPEADSYSMLLAGLVLVGVLSRRRQ